MDLDLLRSLLFVPGDRQRMLDRAPSFGADALVLDLEDAVPPAEKRVARKLVRAAIPRLAGTGRPVFVRVNAVATGKTRADLMDVVRPGLAGVVHPKSNRQQDLRDLDVLLREAEIRNKVRPGDVAVIPLIESPRSVLDCERIATAIDRVVALSFGGEDYATALGVTRSDEALAHARGVIVTVAAALGIPAVDTPFPAIDDPRGLAREARLAAAIGFRGKYVIHPDQVAPVHRAFTPSKDAISDARRVMAAAARAQKQRRGVIALDGRMIDAPVVERARHIVAIADRAAAD